MASTPHKQFVFTNEQMYEKNIFERIYPKFLDAWDENDVRKMYQTTMQFFVMTSQFYRPQMQGILEMFEEIHLPGGAFYSKKSELQLQEEKKLEAFARIIQIWTEISHVLNKQNFFKRQIMIDNNALALPTR